jgi:hypothetical protein
MATFASSFTTLHCLSAFNRPLIWPLQLLFHNISWFLAFEVDAIGTGEGLIRFQKTWLRA